MFPAGTRPERRAPVWRLPPVHPVDVFAAAALLTERSGAYQFVAAVRDPPPDRSAARRLVISEADRVAVGRAAARWRTSPTRTRELVPDLVREHWRKLWAHRNEPVFAPSSIPPPWWRSAVLLLMAADSAAEGLGFPGSSGTHVWLAGVIRHYYAEQLSPRGRYTPEGGGERVREVALTGMNRPFEAVARVTPKSRTAAVGFTLRSFTHHLALLPPRGIARANWIEHPSASLEPDRKPLKLLLIPFPYRIRTGCFRPAARLEEEDWGFFEVEQLWLRSPQAVPDSFARFVAHLIAVAAAEAGGSVDAVVLPELALDWPFFVTLVEHLKECCDATLVVSGINTRELPDRTVERGNFVASAAIWATGRGRAYAISARAKHHRWRLDADQIRRYSLGAALDPDVQWRERIDLVGRSLDVFVFRAGSTFTTLICEDLARADPCQPLVRAIGPNLVLALLMDGPQLRTRWPARYATVLAEDPGSSVLTFTSLGLIARQNDAAEFPPSRVVALWKDEAHPDREITLPQHADALVLTLSARTRVDRTCDGRRDSSLTWSLSGVQPVTAVDREPYRWILG